MAETTDKKYPVERFDALVADLLEGVVQDENARSRVAEYALSSTTELALINAIYVRQSETAPYIREMEHSIGSKEISFKSRLAAGEILFSLIHGDWNEDEIEVTAMNESYTDFQEYSDAEHAEHVGAVTTLLDQLDALKVSGGLKRIT